MREAERAARAEMAAVRARFPPERAQAQRDAIRSLLNEIRAIARRNAALNREVEELEEEADRRSLPYERQVECDAIEDMAGELDGKRHQYYDKCTEFIDIRSHQLKEVGTVEDLGAPASGRRVADEGPPGKQEDSEEWDLDGEDVQIGFDGEGE
jgi:hypothetical protein